jgi:hypothetical protein
MIHGAIEPDSKSFNNSQSATLVGRSSSVELSRQAEIDIAVFLPQPVCCNDIYFVSEAMVRLKPRVNWPFSFFGQLGICIGGRHDKTSLTKFTPS